MNKYLLEIGTEELAYKFIPSAMEQLKSEFAKSLEENKINYGDIKVFATPRRLALLISDIAEKQADTIKTIKGPISSIAYDENGNLTKAAIGFAAKNSVDTNSLFKQDNYIWAKTEQKGKQTKEILKTLVPEIILKLKGTHFMRWADLDIKFQRPVRWIVSLFNTEIVPFEFASVTAGNITHGHRFAEKVEFTISHPDEYLQKLENANVIADVQKRKEKIMSLATEKAKELNADIVFDEELLNEVTFITEWPMPIVCSFDEKYLQIPEKVVVTVMEVHQRYFPLYQNGKLLNKFITISNYTGNTFDNIKAGNERVVAARLEDAVFFVKEDTQKPLVSYLEELKGITFQKGLGSMYDKTKRIGILSEFIAKELYASLNTIERTALLCKADLVTKLVFEFTELQGFIGADYAIRSGELKEVAKGIMEHYFPLNAESMLASGIEGQIVGIADKIDTITAVFADGKKVTGSQDPLGVRRAALGILKTIIKKNLKIDLTKVINLAIDNIPLNIENKEKLYSTIADFLLNRLIIMLSDSYKHDVIEACIHNENVLSNLLDFMQRLEHTTNIVNNNNYPKFHESINRIIRITKDVNEFVNINEDLFVHPQEKDLYLTAKSINENDLTYEQLTDKLFKIIPFISEFFDKVLVMDDNEKIKQNRLALLNMVKTKFNKLADFSKIIL